MYTVQEILDDIDTRIPNTFTNAQKIAWMNEKLFEIYKYFNLQTIDVSKSTIEGQRLYSLPSNCTIDEILSISIANDLTVTSDTTFTEYSYRALNESFDGNNYYNGYNGLFGIYPIPDTTGYTMSIVYEKKPTALNVDDLTSVPEVETTHLNLLKYYCLNVIAKSGHNPDVSLANNYMMEYNNLWSQMFKSKQEKEAKIPNKKRCNGWWK